MLKNKYLMNDESIQALRDIKHLIYFFIFIRLTDKWLIWPNYTLIASLGYFISFAYHRLPFLEFYFRLFDYSIILLRIILFSKNFDINLFLTPILIIYFVYQIFKNSKVQNDILCFIFDLWKYYYLYVVLYLAYYNENREILFLSFIYLPTALLYMFKFKMPWHTEYWEAHEDFHLSLIIADTLLYLFY